MKKLLLAILLTLSATTYADSCPTLKTEQTECIVAKVIDGDTFHAYCNKVYTKIRMVEIDSYESRLNNRAYKQAWQQKLTPEQIVGRGKKASSITKKELLNKHVILTQPQKQKIDIYGRTLAKVYIDCVDINNKFLIEHPDVYLKY